MPEVSWRVGRPIRSPEMEPLGELHDGINPGLQAVGDEIGVARKHDGPAEIVIPRRRQVMNRSPANVNVTGIVDCGMRIESGLQAGQADDRS